MIIEIDYRALLNQYATLTDLDLSYNMIIRIDDDFSTMVMKYNISINMTGNPLSSFCDNALLKMASTRSDLIVSKVESSDGQPINNATFKKVCNKDDTNTPAFHLPVWGLLLAGAVVMIVVIFLFYFTR